MNGGDGAMGPKTGYKSSRYRKMGCGAKPREDKILNEFVENSLILSTRPIPFRFSR